MPTLAGAVFAVLLILCLVRRRNWLFGLVIVSSLFEASSALNFGSQGIQPYYFVAVAFILSQASRMRLFTRQDSVLLLFGVVAIGSALVCPFLFAGIPVYSPAVGIDDGFFIRPPLVFGLGNVAQAAYLVIHILMVVAAASAPRNLQTRRGYDFAFAVLVFLVLSQFLCAQAGLPFPYGVLQSNPGYAVQTVATGDAAARVMGPFTESSSAGIVLAAFFAAYFFEFYVNDGPGTRVLVAAACLGLVRSSTGLFAMFAVAGLILVFYPVFRSALVLRQRRLVKFGYVTVASLLAIASPLSAALSDYTTQKSDTMSFVNRTAADLFAVQLASDTHWIGVGLGSNRPSSLAATLLSSVGALGTLFFLILIIQAARKVPKSMLWIRWSLLGIIIAKCIAGPDINEPFMWISIALAAYSVSPDAVTSAARRRTAHVS